MKVSEINKCYNVLTKMESKKLPISLGLILLQNKKKLEPLTETIGSKEQFIINSYAEKDDTGEVNINENNQYKIPKEHVASYTKDMAELMETEMEVSFDKTKMESLNRCDEEGYDALTMEELEIIQDYMM